MALNQPLAGGVFGFNSGGTNYSVDRFGNVTAPGGGPTGIADPFATGTAGNLYSPGSPISLSDMQKQAFTNAGLTFDESAYWYLPARTDFTTQSVGESDTVQIPQQTFGTPVRLDPSAIQTSPDLAQFTGGDPAAFIRNQQTQELANIDAETKFHWTDILPLLATAAGPLAGASGLFGAATQLGTDIGAASLGASTVASNAGEPELATALGLTGTAAGLGASAGVFGDTSVGFLGGQGGVAGGAPGALPPGSFEVAQNVGGGAGGEGTIVSDGGAGTGPLGNIAAPAGAPTTDATAGLLSGDNPASGITFEHSNPAASMFGVGSTVPGGDTGGISGGLGAAGKFLQTPQGLLALGSLPLAMTLLGGQSEVPSSLNALSQGGAITGPAIGAESALLSRGLAGTPPAGAEALSAGGTVTAPLIQTEQQQLNAANTQTLTPPQQAEIDRFTQQAESQLYQQIANMGASDPRQDSRYITGLQQIEQQALAMKENFISQAFQTGTNAATAAAGNIQNVESLIAQEISQALSAAGTASQGIGAVANAQLQSDTDFQSALRAAAQSLGLVFALGSGRTPAAGSTT